MATVVFENSKQIVAYKQKKAKLVEEIAKISDIMVSYFLAKKYFKSFSTTSANG